MKRLSLILLALTAAAQSPELTAIVSKSLNRTVDLPGEFAPFQSVSVRAKVKGYVDKVLVDRGSRVKQGQLLAELTAPEMKAQIAEAQSRVLVLESDRLQAASQLTASEALLARLKKAAETPGAIAGSEIEQAEAQVAAAKALVESRRQAGIAAQAAVAAQRELETYLKITAPFDGIVTERLIHPGALAGPGADPALLTLEDLSHLRLVVAVPEEYTGGIVPGAKVEFKVPAFPEKTFSGTIARLSHSLDAKTRTMAVEMEVPNRDGSLAPGMYPQVKWPVRRNKPSLMAPKTAVVTTTERTFVIRANEGKAEWVSVSKGAADGDLVEVSGNLKAGDKIVRKAGDEIRDGSPLKP